MDWAEHESTAHSTCEFKTDWALKFSLAIYALLRRYREAGSSFLVHRAGRWMYGMYLPCSLSITREQHYCSSLCCESHKRILTVQSCAHLLTCKSHFSRAEQPQCNLPDWTCWEKTSPVAVWTAEFHLWMRNVTYTAVVTSWVAIKQFSSHVWECP